MSSKKCDTRRLTHILLAVVHVGIELDLIPIKARLMLAVIYLILAAAAK
jgi:hypothetical protein